MQQLTTFQDDLRAIRRELVSGEADRQDRLMTRWHQRLEAAAAQLIPSFYGGLCVNLLDHYRRNVLPRRLPPQLAGMVSATVQDTISRLNAQRQAASACETRLAALAWKLRAKAFRSADAFCRALGEIVAVSMPTVRPDRDFERHYREFCDAPFTSTHVVAFFTEFLLHRLPEPLRTSFSPMEMLFWDQLANHLYPPAVLIDLTTEQAEILRFEMAAEASTTADRDRITFKDEVDETMRQSCAQALRAARRYVETIAPDALNGRKIHITCCFQHPLKTYRDTSISLLMAIKAIGDLLNLEQHPDIVISGELDEYGVIRPVSFISQKIDAVDRQAGIRRIVLPANSQADSRSNVPTCPVRTLTEAVEGYYGAALKHRMRPISRRAFVSGAIGFALGAAAATSSRLFVTKNLFAHSVTEEDWQLAEYARIQYQTYSDYSVTTVLTALLDKVRNESDPDAMRLKALCFREFGVIYLQQHRIRESLDAMQEALRYWQAIKDRENQADTLLSIGEAYRYLVGIDGRMRDAQEGLASYDHAFGLLEKTMPLYQRWMGKYYALTGCLYNELGEYERAEQFGRRGMEIFEPIENNWTYQTCRQHVGRMLIHTGKYDEANDLIQSTMQAAVLQSPYYQVRSYWTLADLRLSTNNIHGGREALSQAEQFCEQYHFSGQRRMIEKIAAKHGVTL